MELDRLGSPSIGERIFEVYERATGDKPFAPLVDFYKGFRACEQAKMAVLRAAQLTGRQQTPWITTAREYLRLAAHCLEQCSRPNSV
jgi:aminoglycoside phosphotransferase family enzyme